MLPTKELTPPGMRRDTRRYAAGLAVAVLYVLQLEQAFNCDEPVAAPPPSSPLIV